MNAPRTVTLSHTLPTDEEGIKAFGVLVQNSRMPAEHQISLRLWFTGLLQAAGVVLPEEPPAPDEPPDPPLDPEDPKH